MGDIYGVTPDMIAKELPGLFRDGFGVSTTPSHDDVASFIATADTLVRLRVARASGAPASSADEETAALARAYIVNAVKAQLIRIVLTANEPSEVAAAAAPYERLAASMLTEIAALEAPATTSDFGWAGTPSGTTVNAPSWF